MKARNTSSPRRTALILASSIAALLTAQSAQAATYYWDGGTANIAGNGDGASAGGTGNWSTAIANWDNGAVPHVVWATGNTADFGGTAGTVTLGSAISATGLIFETSGYTIQSGASQVLTLTGATIDTGVAGTTTTVNAKLTGASVPINGSGTITFGGADDNNGFSMVVNSGVTAILAKDSSSTVHVTGGTGVVVNAGGLARLAGTGGDQMADTAVLNLQGGTFDLNGRTEAINTLTGTSAGIVDNLAVGAAALTVGNLTGTASFAGVIQNTGGSLSLTKIGSGTATLTGVNTYTGATTVSAGILTLAGTSGSLSGVSATPITVNGGEFRLDNTTASGGNNNTRIADTQAITLNANTIFNYIGSDAGASSETVGTVNLAAVPAGVSGAQARITTTGTGANSSTLTLAGLTRTAGGAVALVNGTSLGSDSASSLQRIIVTTPTLVGTTAALSTGINAAAKDTQIVPFLVGEATSTTGGVGTVAGTANTFLTHNATTGLRPLNLTDEFTSNATTTGNNIYVTADTTATNNSINSLVLSGTPTLSIATGVTLTNESGAVLFGGTTGTANISGAGTGTLAFGGNEAIVTVNNGVTGVVSAILTGSAGLTKSGTGTLTLTGANTIGAFNVNSGTLRLQTSVAQSGTGTNNAIPTGATVNVANGSVLNLTNTVSGSGGGNQPTVNFNNFALNLNGGTSLTVTSSNLTKYNLPGDITLTGSNTISVTPIRATLALSGVISGSGSLTFSTSGSQNSHFLTLLKANNYTGSTTITAGSAGATILLAGGADRLPATTTLTITNTSTLLAQLNLGGQNQTLAGLISGGTATQNAVVNTGGGTPTLTLNQASGVSTTFSGILGGANAIPDAGNNTQVSGSSFGLTKSGLGTQVLGGTNLYTGATLVNGGTLSLTNVAALGASSGVSVTNGATLLVDGVVLSYTGNITISGSGVGGVGALNFGSAANSRFTTGSVTIADGDSAAFGSTKTTSGNNIVNGITGGTNASPVSLSKVGGGILSWESGNSYVGTVAVAAGTLNLASTSGRPITGAVTVSPGASLSLGRTNDQIFNSASVTIDGTFDLNNDANTGAARPRAETIGSLSGASTGLITTTSTVVTSSGINSGELLTTAASGITTFAGTIQDGTRQVLFTKGGAYKQILSGANTYTGPTSVTAGTLEVSGSISGTTSVGLTGGTLLLSANNVTNATNTSSTVTNTGVPSVPLGGGSLKIDDSLSNLSETFGALTLSTTSTLDFGAGGNNRFNFDSLSITTGVLNVLNWSVGTYAGANPDDGTTTNDRLLFTQDASSVASQINFYSGGTTASGFLGTGSQISFGGAPGFEIVPVPEPSSTALLGAVALLGLGGFRERRRWRCFAPQL